MARTVRGLPAFAVLAAVVAMAGCGSSDSDDAPATNGAAKTTDEQGGPAALSQEEAVKTALAYTGGQAGKADPSKEPIVIGWMNQDSGTAATPQYTLAVRAGVAFVNEELGGVQGHPLKLEECIVGVSPEEGQACAQKLLNDPAVDVIAAGEAGAAQASFMTPVGRSNKPLFPLSPLTPAEGTFKNAFVLRPSLLALASQAAFLEDYAKAKSVSVIWPDTPDARAFLDFNKQIFTAEGIKTYTGLMAPDATDAVGPAVAGKVQQSDAIQFTPLSTSMCIQFGKALKQLAIDSPVLSLSNCLDPAVKKALGDWAPNWTYFFDYPSMHLPDPSGQVGTLLYAFEKYADSPGLEDQLGAPPSFGAVLTLAKWLGETGPENISLASVKDVAYKDPGPLFLGQPEVKFGTKPYPAVAGLATRFFTYVGDGKWDDATDGEWVITPVSADG